jgi:hypothetical protein
MVNNKYLAKLFFRLYDKSLIDRPLLVDPPRDAYKETGDPARLSVLCWNF